MMEKFIQLYKPAPLDIDPCITQQHWYDAAEECEDMLVEWLGVPDSHNVLLLDCCTAALEVGFRALGRKLALIPQRTHRAPLDAARLAGYQVEILPVSKYSAWVADPGRDAVYVPTTLGGTRLAPYHWHEWMGGILCDCSHTCYPGMFCDIPMGSTTMFVLSFCPTRPLGALGGGALIAHRDVTRRLRDSVWPIGGLSPVCAFRHPQAVQSFAIMQRIEEWDENVQAQARSRCATIAAIVEERYRLHQVWTDLYTPHVLAFSGQEAAVEALRRNCYQLQIETSDHYPPLWEFVWKHDHISLPFWTDEVAERLSR